MSDATADMSLQESCIDAARHLSVEVHLLASKADELERENAKLLELVRGLVYATHPADRARLIADAAEFGIEVDG